MKKVPALYFQKVFQAIVELSYTPYPNNSKKMAGASSLYRIRVGDFRLVYLYDPAEPYIQLMKIFRREKGY